MKNQPKQGDTIAVWFSCGAASAVALKKTIEKYPFCNVIALNNYIKEEDPDNRRFLKDVAEWVGIDIQNVASKRYPSGSCVDVWENRSYMGGVGGAPCTSELKFMARLDWEKENHTDFTVMGFTLEETHRHEKLKINIPELLPVLIDEGTSKKDCFNIIMNAGIKLPRIYTEKGYPNANCIGCVKASSPTYWNHVRRQDPEVFKSRADMSARIGAKLVRVKGERIFLKDLDPDAVGRPMKDMDFECGITCPSED